MKKLKNMIKIFLALVIAFSQLSNATLVLAAEVTDNEISVGETEPSNEGEFTENETFDEEDDDDKETLEGETEPGTGDTTGEEENLEENNDDEENSVDNTEDDNTTGSEVPSDNGENPEENPEVNTGEVEEPSEGETPEEKTEFTLEDLEVLMNAYINEEEVPQELIDLLIAKGAPSIENGEFTELTLEDIMFVSELLKEIPDTDTEREENEYLKLELGEVPEEVNAGDTFNVEVIVSNEVLEELTDEEGNPIISEDFIDGIEGLVTTSENLKAVNVEFNEFNGVNNEEGKFVAAGSEYGEDKGVLLTITFEALEEGEGEVTISGKIAKYLTINDFEDLTFTITINPKEEVSIGLETLTSNVGEFDKEFDSEVTEYTLTIPEGTTELTLSGSLINDDDEVTGLSQYTIDSDNMTITVVVTDSEGNEKTYTINVVRIANESEVEEATEEVEKVIETPVVNPIVYYVYSSNNYLKTLNIKDFEIDFSKSTLEYKLKVKSDVKFLDITAVAEDYRSRVEINGNEEFKEGENVVTIKVTAENGDVREYKLLVEKEAKEVSEEEETSSKTEKIVIIILIILVVLGLLYLIFKKDDEESNKISNVKNNNDNKNNKNNYNNYNNKNKNDDKNHKKYKER